MKSAIRDIQLHTCTHLLLLFTHLGKQSLGKYMYMYWPYSTPLGTGRGPLQSHVGVLVSSASEMYKQNHVRFHTGVVSFDSILKTFYISYFLKILYFSEKWYFNVKFKATDFIFFLGGVFLFRIILCIIVKYKVLTASKNV